MNRTNNKGAAGLRRSAVAERIRLREEWSALKGITDVRNHANKRAEMQRNILNKNQSEKENLKTIATQKTKNLQVTDALRGIVALVEVGSEHRALALRAALGALGATVVPTWSPLVTHVVWAQGGCRATRAKARALACRLVSPLWVEACAASARRLPENTFPAAARPSDLPSPRTLKILLKKAEMENIPLADLLSDSKDDSDQKPLRLRISSENEQDTSADKSADTSVEKSVDTSLDKSKDTTTDTESRVNTAPRRALPVSTSPPRPTKSRRKLFTHKEAELSSNEESVAEKSPAKPKRVQAIMTQHEKRDLARAERIAKRLVTAHTQTEERRTTDTYIIVLTGMSRSERQTVSNAIRSLNGKIKSTVTKKTTHVLLGSCKHDNCDTTNVANISGVGRIASNSLRNELQKPRTLNALLGAARGCRVLYAQWALDSLSSNKWLHHHGYEVPYLKKISQKAHVERAAIGKLRSEYAYNVFHGIKVRVLNDAEQRDGVIQLLMLCGAVVQNADALQNGRQTQNVVRTQNGGQTQNNHTQTGFDITIGSSEDEISSKWVFDSVAAARMRSTRRYVNTVMTFMSSSNLITQTTDRS